MPVTAPPSASESESVPLRPAISFWTSARALRFAGAVAAVLAAAWASMVCAVACPTSCAAVCVGSVASFSRFAAAAAACPLAVAVPAATVAAFGSSTEPSRARRPTPAATLRCCAAPAVDRPRLRWPAQWQPSAPRPASSAPARSRPWRQPACRGLAGRRWSVPAVSPELAGALVGEAGSVAAAALRPRALAMTLPKSVLASSVASWVFVVAGWLLAAPVARLRERAVPCGWLAWALRVWAEGPVLPLPAAEPSLLPVANRCSWSSRCRRRNRYRRLRPGRSHRWRSDHRRHRTHCPRGRPLESE